MASVVWLALVVFAVAPGRAAAVDEELVKSGIRAASQRLSQYIKDQNWLGIADYSPPDRVELGVTAALQAYGGYKGGAREAAVFKNILGGNIPPTLPGDYQWHEELFDIHVESEAVAHVIGFGNTTGSLACNLMGLPDHRGLAFYERYRLDLDGVWRIQVLVFPIGGALAQYRATHGRPPTAPCPPPPRSPLLGDAPLLPGTDSLIHAVRPTSTGNAPFSGTTGYGRGTREQSEEAQRQAAVRSAALSKALAVSHENARQFFAQDAVAVQEDAMSFISADELLRRRKEFKPLNTTFAFAEVGGAVHEMGHGGLAGTYYTRWERVGRSGEWLIVVHVFPVGPPPSGPSEGLRGAEEDEDAALALVAANAASDRGVMRTVGGCGLLLSAAASVAYFASRRFWRHDSYETATFRSMA